MMESWPVVVLPRSKPPGERGGEGGHSTVRPRTWSKALRVRRNAERRFRPGPCTRSVSRREQGNGERPFSFTVGPFEPLSRLKQLLQEWGGTGLTVPEMSLEQVGLPPLPDDERPIADLLWRPQGPVFVEDTLYLRPAYRVNSAGEHEFVVYLCRRSWYSNVEVHHVYVTGSHTVGALRAHLRKDYLTTELHTPEGIVMEEDPAWGDHFVLYDYRDGRLLDDKQTLAESGVTAGSLMGIEPTQLGRMTPHAPPGAPIPVPVRDRDSGQHWTLPARPHEELGCEVRVRLWVSGHITVRTGDRELRIEGREPDPHHNYSSVERLGIGPGSKLELVPPYYS